MFSQLSELRVYRTQFCRLNRSIIELKSRLRATASGVVFLLHDRLWLETWHVLERKETSRKFNDHRTQFSSAAIYWFSTIIKKVRGKKSLTTWKYAALCSWIEVERKKRLKAENHIVMQSGWGWGFNATREATVKPRAVDVDVAIAFIFNSQH